MDSKNIPLLLVAVVSLGFFGLMIILSFHSVPSENKDTLEAMLGVLSASFGGIVGYYFGASKSKAEAGNAAPVPASPQPTPPSIDEQKAA